MRIQTQTNVNNSGVISISFEVVWCLLNLSISVSHDEKIEKRVRPDMLMTHRGVYHSAIKPSAVV
jgi:hypothetical protein